MLRKECGVLDELSTKEKQALFFYKDLSSRIRLNEQQLHSKIEMLTHFQSFIHLEENIKKKETQENVIAGKNIKHNGNKLMKNKNRTQQRAQIKCSNSTEAFDIALLPSRSYHTVNKEIINKRNGKQRFVRANFISVQGGYHQTINLKSIQSGSSSLEAALRTHPPTIPHSKKTSKTATQNRLRVLFPSEEFPLKQIGTYDVKNEGKTRRTIMTKPFNVTGEKKHREKNAPCNCETCIFTNKLRNNKIKKNTNLIFDVDPFDKEIFKNVATKPNGKSESSSPLLICSCPADYQQDEDKDGNPPKINRRISIWVPEPPPNTRPGSSAAEDDISHPYPEIFLEECEISTEERTTSLSKIVTQLIEADDELNELKSEVEAIVIDNKTLLNDENILCNDVELETRVHEI